MLITSAKFLGIASKAEVRWRDTESLLAFGRKKKNYTPATTSKTFNTEKFFHGYFHDVSPHQAEGVKYWPLAALYGFGCLIISCLLQQTFVMFVATCHLLESSPMSRKLKPFESYLLKEKQGLTIPAFCATRV